MSEQEGDKVQVKEDARKLDICPAFRRYVKELKWEGIISSPAYVSEGWEVEFGVEKNVKLVHIFEEHELEVIL